LDFSDFNPKIFGIFIFRAEKFWPEKLSRQKNPVVPTFEQKIFNRKKFQTVRVGCDRPEKFLGNVHAPSVGDPESGDFPTFVAIVLEFVCVKCPRQDFIL